MVRRSAPGAARGAQGMIDATVLTGGCHCGNLQLRFETRLPAAQLPVRSCVCSFCVRHGAHTTSDPAGFVRITVRDARHLVRYRFGLRTADFLVCGQCGVYLAAVLPDGKASTAVVNVNALAERTLLTRDPIAVSYDDEDKAERVERRRARWTPAEIAVRQARTAGKSRRKR